MDDPKVQIALALFCAWANQRRGSHIVGGRRKYKQHEWTVPAGMVGAGNHAFLRRILSPRDISQKELASIHIHKLKGLEMDNLRLQ